MTLFDAFDFRILEENLRATLSVFSRARQEGEVRHYPGVTAICAAVPYSTFNAALLTAPAATANELRQRIEIAALYFQRRGFPWSVWLCEEWLEKRVRRRARRVLEEVGMHVLTEMPGMAAERLRPATRDLPPLEFRPVGDEPTRRAFEQVMAASFGIPYSVAHQIYGQEATWEEGLTGWVGYLHGCPVTTAATRVAGGVIGLYAVGTLPAFQRQGCAEAVVRHAIARAQAASGLERSVLQSSASGLRLYEKLGYRTLARYVVYASYR